MSIAITMPSRRVVKIIGAIAVSGLVFAAGRLSGPDEATSVLSIDHPAPNVTTIQVPVGRLTPRPLRITSNRSTRISRMTFSQRTKGSKCWWRSCQCRLRQRPQKVAAMLL